MSFSSAFISTPTLESIQDTFAKYHTRFMVQNMPFKLYFDRGDLFQAKKRTARGPYRKYIPQEKRDIIQRIFQGVKLKSIALQTGIPKRNLIRWKHQFLLNRNVSLNAGSGSQESEQLCERKSCGRIKQSVETKSSFSQSSIKNEKIEV